MTLFRVDPSKDLFFSILWTNGPVRTYPVHGCLRPGSIEWVRVLYTCSVVLDLKFGFSNRCFSNRLATISPFSKLLVKNTSFIYQTCIDILSVRKPCVFACNCVYIFDWFLLHGGSLPSRNCLLLPLGLSSGGGTLTRHSKDKKTLSQE